MYRLTTWYRPQFHGWPDQGEWILFCFMDGSYEAICYDPGEELEHVRAWTPIHPPE
jgi:hypothetical protein